MTKLHFKNGCWHYGHKMLPHLKIKQNKKTGNWSVYDKKEDTWAIFDTWLAVTAYVKGLIS